MFCHLDGLKALSFPPQDESWL